jgi:hypothetical protein
LAAEGERNGGPVNDNLSESSMGKIKPYLLTFVTTAVCIIIFNKFVKPRLPASLQ